MGKKSINLVESNTESNLLLNISRTKELIVDFRKRKPPSTIYRALVKCDVCPKYTKSTITLDPVAPYTFIHFIIKCPLVVLQQHRGHDCDFTDLVIICCNCSK